MTPTPTIDVHAHVVPPTVAERITADGHRLGVEQSGAAFGEGFRIAGKVETGPVEPELLDVDRRLAAMDEMRVDVQLLSPWIDLTAYALPGDQGHRFARLLNEELAAVAAAHPARFRALCTVPLQSPTVAADELWYAVSELGMKGVEIATTVAGRDLDDASLAPFWNAAEELGCLVLLHPCASLAGRGVRRYFLGNLVGNPAETTVAVAHLIFGGVLTRHPDLRICLVHGGGFLPYQLGRWDHAYEHDVRGCAANLDRAPSTWARELYYDTVLHSPGALADLVDVVGPDRIVLGSDYPFEMGDPDPLRTVDATVGLTDSQRDAIRSGTALGLLARVHGATAGARVGSGKAGG